MSSVAVIGAGFGDEGKGKVVSYLCTQYENPLVVRFCGGHQAGHRVVVNGQDHIFSNFGSGTLQGAPTLWTKFCTVDPVGLLNEYSVLKDKVRDARLYLDRRCPVTTPWDKYANLKLEEGRKHGTCGVGFGQTLQREADHYSLTVEDLFHPTIVEIKLKHIAKYYWHTCIFVPESAVEEFVEACRILTTCNFILPISDVHDILYRYPNKIFEGAQGLLLDQNYGFFPHVTRSNTGLTNLEELETPGYIWLVSRAYQTRHGYGPMTNTDIPIEINNKHEHNKDTGAQGIFRKSVLDLDLLRYGMRKDKIKDKHRQVSMVVTCLDALKEYKFRFGSAIHKCSSEEDFLKYIKLYLGVDTLYISKSPGPEMAGAL